MSDSNSACRKLFSQLDISSEHIPNALLSLKQDSQKGTFGKRGVRPEITEAEWESYNAYLKQLGVTDFSSETTFEDMKALII